MTYRRTEQKRGFKGLDRGTGTQSEHRGAWRRRKGQAGALQ